MNVATFVCIFLHDMCHLKTLLVSNLHTNVLNIFPLASYLYLPLSLYAASALYNCFMMCWNTNRTFSCHISGMDLPGFISGFSVIFFISKMPPQELQVMNYDKCPLQRTCLNSPTGNLFKIFFFHFKICHNPTLCPP